MDGNDVLNAPAGGDDFLRGVRTHAYDRSWLRSALRRERGGRKYLVCVCGERIYDGFDFVLADGKILCPDCAQRWMERTLAPARLAGRT